MFIYIFSVFFLIFDQFLTKEALRDLTVEVIWYVGGIS